MEQVGKLDHWDYSQKRGGPVASPIVRGFLTFEQGEQRRVRVGGKQASPVGGNPAA